MNIILKNKFLYFENYKLRCSIGKSGISSKKKEGDNKTPKGNFKFEYILYRRDRVLKIKANLKKIIIMVVYLVVMKFELSPALLSQQLLTICALSE